VLNRPKWAVIGAYAYHRGMVQPPDTATDPAWTPDALEGNPHARQDKAERVQRMFSAIAGSYDLNNRLHSFGRDQAWRRAAVRLAEVTPSDRILDVACGTGDLTLAFARARPAPASVTGLDFTPQMLDVARCKSAGGTTSFVEGDAMSLPFGDASFDVISIAFGIRNVSDPARALREFRRVLSPGGRLVILEFGHPRQPLLRWLNDLYTHRVMPFTASLVARDRSGAYRYLPASVASFLDPRALADAVSQAGFSDVRQHPLTFGVCVATTARVGHATTLDRST
jgi:demethylmenaquinone methyltransferase/2-methoxy-6-polyprenyl-1,4-benzoquinol methylase